MSDSTSSSRGVDWGRALSAGFVATAAMTDHDRLLEGSLIYVGCRRTPVCALVDRLEFRGSASRVMNELFATIDDARLVLGATCRGWAQGYGKWQCFCRTPRQGA